MNIPDMLRMIQQVLEDCDIVVQRIATLQDKDSKRQCVAHFERQIQGIHESMNRLEEACLRAAVNEHNQRFEALVEETKLLRSQHPLSPEAVQSKEDLVEVRNLLSDTSIELEGVIESYFRYARKKLFQLSIIAQAL